MLFLAPLRSHSIDAWQKTLLGPLLSEYEVQGAFQPCEPGLHLPLNLMMFFAEGHLGDSYLKLLYLRAFEIQRH